MKSIIELTEQEIRNLSYDDVELLIKFRKLEEGIKLVDKPEPPLYHGVPKADHTVYKVNFLGGSLVFDNIEDAQELIQLIKSSQGVYKLEYGVNSTYFSNSKLHSYSGEWDSIVSEKVYSEELYKGTKENISKNNKAKSEYETELKGYYSILEDSKWIEDEIRDKVREIQDKYQKLESLTSKFRMDYVSLTDDVDVAMKFMDKAYSLTDEQKEYILTNYKL